jgi:hypothetical protein
MLVAIGPFRKYLRLMPAQGIVELEKPLLTANEAVGKLTATNAELTSQLSTAEVRNRKLKRSASRDKHASKDQVAVAQSRRD